LNDDGKFNELDVVKTPLRQNGDFRSHESIQILKEADIVVTNPPFSLFREYVAQLIEYNKKFLVLGNMNAVTYKETFPILKDEKMWWGVSLSGSNDVYFKVPSDYELPKAVGHSRVAEDGTKYFKLRNVVWYTNLDFKKRHERFDSYKIYSPDEYPKYDDYDAINIGKVKDIPEDYYGAMGVPISFLGKHNPEQFEILGMDDHRMQPPKWRGRGPSLNGKNIYRRLIIQRKKENTNED
jgi:hypothetical protein